jgi:hypothetical protein
MPLGIDEIEAWEEYIVRAHNPRFVKVSRQTTSRDLSKLFTERHNILKNSVLPENYGDAGLHKGLEVGRKKIAAIC